MTVDTLCLPMPLRWRSGVATDPGRVRQINQDACLARPQFGLWAVADGMGGHRDGGIASAEIVTALAAIPRARLLGRGANRVSRALAAVNTRLLAHAKRLGDDVVGSTIIVFLAVGRHCAVLWAGDSRAYRLRDRTLTQLTNDHSQVQAMVDAAIIQANDAHSHPFANVLLRAVGTDERLVLDYRILDVRVGDRFLLCSDGLYRDLSAADMALILGTESPEIVAPALVAAACERDGSDNITAVVIECMSGSQRGPVCSGAEASSTSAAV